MMDKEHELAFLKEDLKDAQIKLNINTQKALEIEEARIVLSGTIMQLKKDILGHQDNFLELTDKQIVLQYKNCKKKVRYKSEIKALNALKSKKKEMFIPENANAYHCPICEKYHLGHRKMDKEN